jgi:hypothetical protein
MLNNVFLGFVDFTKELKMLRYSLVFGTKVVDRSVVVSIHNERYAKKSSYS